VTPAESMPSSLRRQDEGRSPVVSVVMPLFNGESFVGAAIQSVLSQTLENLELIVVDDGSTDGGPEIVTEHAARDRRIRLHRQENRGAAAANNTGVAHARSELIAHLDADDLAVTDRLETQSRALLEDQRLGLVGGGVRMIDGTGREFAEVRYPCTDAAIRAAISSSNPFAHSAVTMRRSAFRAAGGYRPQFEPAEDIDLWLRIGEEWSFANLERTVVEYRLHESQASYHKLERQAIRSVAARISARCRAADGKDPLDRVEAIDSEMLLNCGASGEEIDAAVIDSMTWFAKTFDRAGRHEAAKGIFASARGRARADSGSASSKRGIVEINRAEAALHREKGHAIRAGLAQLRARLSSRRP
jgi:glycosyltransferase involved in cell wall biosynthesis